MSINPETHEQSTLTFAKLRRVNAARCFYAFHPIPAWSPSDWGVALAGEVGEACNIIKKLMRLRSADAILDTPENRAKLREDLGKELADVAIYLDLLATRMDLVLGDEVVKKFNEVSVRRDCLHKFSL